ncbi:transposase, MuDR, MULE transposase domain protein [Tanacetum coccineum]
MNESNYKIEPHFTKPESSFAFGSNDENKDEKNDSDDGVDENPQPIYHKWKKLMSFKPDIPETPVYMSKPIISKHYNKTIRSKKNNIFDNKEALDLAVRLKALNDGFQFLADKSAPKRYELKCYHFNECAWKLRARLWDNTDKYYITYLNDVHTCPKTQTYPNLRNANKKIRTFLNYLRHLLIIDVAHLKGLYKGTNLVAMGMDRNNQIVPITFGICKGETGPCWSWWMSVLKECIGDNPNLLFISNRHPAIALAIHNEFPLAFHVVCCRHLMMNLSLKKKTKGLFWKIYKAYTLEDFASNMSILQVVQPDAYHKVCKAGPHRWSRAHCPLVRYNYMTSNSVESVNACTILNRKLPVLKLAETYHAMVQDWYYKRRELAGISL